MPVGATALPWSGPGGVTLQIPSLGCCFTDDFKNEAVSRSVWALNSFGLFCFEICLVVYLFEKQKDREGG